MLSFKQVSSYLTEQDLRQTITNLVNQIDDDKELEILLNSLLKKYLNQQMEGYEGYSWWSGGAKIHIENLIFNASVPPAEKFRFVKWLKNDEFKFGAEAFQKPTYQSLLDLVPSKMRSNAVFQAIHRDIILFNQQSANGVGKGELFLLMFGKNSEKPSSRGAGVKGDVIIDGWSIEVKGPGAEIHAGKKDGLAQASEVFAYNKQLLERAIKDGYPSAWLGKDGKTIVEADYRYFRFFHPSGSKVVTEGGDWFWRYLKNQWPDSKVKYPNVPNAEGFVIEYMKKVYPTIDGATATKMGKEIYRALGSEAQFKQVVETHIKPWVFNSYKETEQFNSLLVFNNKFNFANIVDGYNTPNQVSFGIPAISKGKSTYAVPAGVISIKIK